MTDVAKLHGADDAPETADNVFNVNGKSVTLTPLTLGDRRKIKEATGIDLFTLTQADSNIGDALDAIVRYGVKKNCDNITDEDVDEVPFSELKAMAQCLTHGLIDRPT